MYILTALLLAGCAKEPPASPVFVTQALPPIPDVCKSPWPSEPKLPPGKDADAIDDRTRLKSWGRAQTMYRRACLQELQAVLPDK